MSNQTPRTLRSHLKELILTPDPSFSITPYFLIEINILEPNAHVFPLTVLRILHWTS